MKALTILAAALAMACASETPASWHGALDVSALPEEQAAIVASALGAWRDASDGAVTATVSDHGLPVVIGDPGVGHAATMACPAAGCTGENYTALVLGDCDTSTQYDACYQAIAHEIGHVFGAKHVADRGAVMFKDDVGNVAITGADLDALYAAVEP